MHEGFIVAIDGPVASGKGTIALSLSERLNGFHIYTGGTYRAAALYCLENGIDINNLPELLTSLDNLSIDLINDSVILNGEDVTEELKKREVANASSPISAIKEVREKMVGIQRETAEREIKEGKTVIAEGRDTGTKVFPDADLKIFLTADPESRARRRRKQYLEKGEEVSLETVLEEISERDSRDMNREIDPLVKNPELSGYFVLDNSEQSPEETVGAIIKEINKRELL